MLSGTAKALKLRNASVVATGTFQRNTVAIRSGLAAMLEAQPDAVIMVGTYAPIAAFVKAARAAGLRSKLATVSFVSTDDLLPLVGTAGDGVVISQVVPFPADATNAIARECRDVISRHAGASLGFVNFEGCIDARVLVTAIQRAGKDLTRARFVAALDAMSAVDLGGITIGLSADNHQASRQVFLTRISDGRAVPIQ